MALIGAQKPALSSSVPAPGFVPGSLDFGPGDQGVEFCRWAGMTLFPWQEDLLRDSRAVARFTNPDDETLAEERVAFPEIVTVVSRQNGKGEYLIGLELSAVYLSDDPVSILHTAHYTTTALSALRRTWDIISESPDLMQWKPWVDKYGEGRASTPKQIVSNGKEGIQFPDGSSIAFRTRSGTQGAGTSNDLLILDECFDLPEGTSDALTYTTRARKNAQTIYISSPVNIYNSKHLHGQKFSSKRWAGVDGAPGVLFREWSLPEGMDPLKREAWVATNPSLITAGAVGKQYRPVEAGAAAAKSSEVELRSFLVEDLGTGNWFPRDGDLSGDFVPLVDLGEWEAKMTAPPARQGENAIGVDVTPDGDRSALVAAIRSEDGFYLSLHPLSEFDRSEVIGAAKKALVANVSNPPLAVALDPSGQCSTLVQPLEKEGIWPEQLNGGQVSKSWELFRRLWEEGRITHDGDPRWVAAWEVAEERSKQGRYRSLERYVGDVSVLVAATFAVWVLIEFSEVEDVPVNVEQKKFVGKARAVRAPKRAAALQF